MRARSEDSAHWKSQYQDVLRELEDKETRWSRLETLLYRNLSRLTAAGYGMDAGLDRRLDALRDALRERVDPKRLDTLVDGVSRHAAELETRRDTASGTPAPGEVVRDLLRRIALPAVVEPKARALDSSLGASPAPATETLCGEFSALVQEALTGAAEEAAARGAGTGVSASLLDEILDRLELPAPLAERSHAVRRALGDARDEDEPAIRDALDAFLRALASACEAAGSPSDVLEDILERLRPPADARPVFEALAGRVRNARDPEMDALIDDLASALSNAMAGTSDDDTPPIDQVLRDLLERMDLPAEASEEVRTIRSRITAGMTSRDLPDVIGPIAGLVSGLRMQAHQERLDFERFLLDVTGRLQELEQYLQAAESDRTDALQSGIDLRQQVGAEVRGIREQVREAGDFDQLKEAVQLRLATIESHMEQFVTTETRRDEESSRELARLRERLQETERESGWLRDRLRKKHEEALRDPLTGIANRVAYDARLAQEYARWKRYGEPLSLIFWDIDHFKRINDTYGHQAGDRVLAAVARIMQGSIRETDFLARFGGEEFVMMLPRTSAEAALTAAEKLRRNVEQANFHYREHTVPVTICGGVAEFGQDDTPETVTRRADDALYQAKDEGRNRCVVAPG